MTTKVDIYYADWCPHCAVFKNAATWDVLQKTLMKKGIEVNKYEDGQNHDEIVAQGITGFPTIYVTKDGKRAEYIGPKTGEDIIKWIDQGMPQKGGGPGARHIYGWSPIAGTSWNGLYNVGGPQYIPPNEMYYKKKYKKYKAKYLELKAKLDKSLNR